MKKESEVRKFEWRGKSVLKVEDTGSPSSDNEISPFHAHLDDFDDDFHHESQLMFFIL